ncbi:unnamed protein product [Cylindrotheca closterium]|uniref:Prolyl 4-hydroxylase alpha subunit domain-containing protein n=1 Tax=Cylindrotheca closterium TaxID=2856 RepID=A0AAD2PX96_9STRA|nr:unnamed protein product [Cylindrotheca closterium]
MRQRSFSLRAVDTAVSTNIPVLNPLRSAPFEAEVLSNDPLIYKIPNLLSPRECQTLLSQVKVLGDEQREEGIIDGEDERILKRSNPPQVSLEISKLWPLPFLSILAGIPPLIHYYYEQNASQATPAASFLDILSQLPPSDVLSLILPPIGAALGLSLLLAFGVILPLVQQLSNQSSRTSLAVALNQERDFYLVQDLVQRVSKATQHDWSRYEAPVLTYYPPGALFAKHADASPTKGSEWKDEGGQRVVTCICYLNTMEPPVISPGGTGGGGGETSFDQLGIDVAPEQGSALVFFPTVPGDSLEADPLLTHESLPSESSEKYIIQMFGRVGRVPPPLGLPDSFGALVSSSDN